MIGYATRTGTRRNLKALRDAGWRLLVTPACPRAEGFRYALDNGAWSAFQQGRRWDEAAFRRLLASHADGADFVVAPDIVAGGVASLELSMSWLRHLLGETARVLIPVQDGMSPGDLRDVANSRVGIFVGGSTDWKLSTAPVWGRLAAESECYLHVGRVNTARRIHFCAAVGADSFDGTSASRYAETLPLLDGARRQVPLFTTTGR